MNSEAARRWVSHSHSRLSLLLRFGPRTVVAYGKIIQTILFERLWTVPPRRQRWPTTVTDARTHAQGGEVT